MNKQIALMIFRLVLVTIVAAYVYGWYAYHGDVAKAEIASFVFFIIPAGLIVLVGIQDIILTKRAN